MVWWVYVIAGNGRAPVKIGSARNPEARLRGLQAGSPVKLRLHGAVEVASRKVALRIEGAVHRLLAGRRLHGEWFGLSPAIALEIISERAAWWPMIAAQRDRRAHSRKVAARN